MTILEENDQVATGRRLRQKFGEKLHNAANEKKLAVVVEDVEEAVHDVGEEGGATTDGKWLDFCVVLCKHWSQGFDERGTGLDGVLRILLKHGVKIGQKVLHLLRFPFYIQRIQLIGDPKERPLHLIHFPRDLQARVANKLQLPTIRCDMIPQLQIA